MNREFKFRAYHKHHKKMYEVIGLYQSNGRVIRVQLRGMANLIPMAAVELMQYTGCNDSTKTSEYPKGQDIFEGDILKRDKKIFKVKWGMGEPSFFALTNETHGNCYSVSGLGEHGAVVIGNIYENPELLGG